MYLVRVLVDGELRHVSATTMAQSSPGEVALRLLRPSPSSRLSVRRRVPPEVRQWLRAGAERLVDDPPALVIATPRPVAASIGVAPPSSGPSRDWPDRGACRKGRPSAARDTCESRRRR